MSVFGPDAFGVELHAVNRQLAVLQAHDDAVVQFGRDLKAVGQGGAVHDQRMIPRCLERRGQARKKAGAGVPHRAHLAMNDLGARTTLPPKT